MNVAHFKCPDCGHRVRKKFKRYVMVPWCGPCLGDSEMALVSFDLDMNAELVTVARRMDLHCTLRKTFRLEWR